jgi:hypothetical protein
MKFGGFSIYNILEEIYMNFGVFSIYNILKKFRWILGNFFQFITFWRNLDEFWGF